MSIANEHRFHIPVLGIGFSVDTPVKVARYGISSVLSIGDDGLLERMRRYYLEKLHRPFIPISVKEEDSRAKRTSAYLNLVNQIVKEQFEALKNSEFISGSEISKYFEMLPDFSSLKIKYREMLSLSDNTTVKRLQQWLRENIKPGSIDVNVMTKLDRTNFNSAGEALPVEYNDAHAAIRGFAKSDLSGSLILSAGMNPRLFSYMEKLSEFDPDYNCQFRKKIVIKVSDFRSALIQGKFLAKKGLWVSEYRIESGLNCGGHAFATDGYLLGPILEEFKNRKTELLSSIAELYLEAIRKKGNNIHEDKLQIDITVQGGVGKSTEQEFLIRYFGVKSVGWGSPFLLVPEVMNVDEVTLQKLSQAGEKDIYLSGASPLGIPFNNLRNSTKELEKRERVDKGRFGSPCIKKFLMFNTELTDKPVCSASIEFLNKKIKHLRGKNTPPDEYKKEFDKAVEKECICEGLTSSVFEVNKMENPNKSKAVSVCPGPNLAYFSKVSTLKEMVDHIYGRTDLITDHNRPNMFIKEISLYIDYFFKLVEENLKPIPEQTEKYLGTFRENIISGINYYKKMIPEILEETEQAKEKMVQELIALEIKISGTAKSSC